MQELDPRVRQAIDAWLNANSSSSHRAASGALTRAYGDGQTSAAVDVGAYLVARLPATFAAAHFVLKEISKVMPAFSPASFLDAGAGPGTAALAAGAIWPTLQSFCLLESDQRFAKAAAAIAVPFLSGAKIVLGRLQDCTLEADLVAAAYVLSELRAAEIAEAALKLWRASGQALVIIEPGTPHGFARIRAAREALLGAGAHMIGPCPHAKDCPIAGQDWCHFKVQLQRSRAHLHAKGATVPFELESFSWVAVGRMGAPLPEGRIVAPPRVNKVAAQFRVCTHEGLVPRVVAARDKALYKAARKKKWGESLP